jgi:hypothetical protein
MITTGIISLVSVTSGFAEIIAAPKMTAIAHMKPSWRRSRKARALGVYLEDGVMVCSH